MTEWWTYRLSDFLMFSPRTYARMVESYNAALWPAQALVLALALFVLWRASRFSGLVFALAWAHVGWAFFAARYADIFTAGHYLAAACAVQALLMLLMLLVVPARVKTAWPTAAAIVFYPALSIAVLDRTWRHAELFGFMPDATAVATIVFAMTLQQPRWQRMLLCIIPALVLLFGWGTLINLTGV